MKSKVLGKLTTRQILFTSIAAVIAVVVLAAFSQPALADQITVPPVPPNINVTADEGRVYLVGHAIGTQNYICLPSGSGVAYALFTPQATLADDNENQIITHFFSVNPANDIIRATWESSQDTSTIWAAVVPDGSSTAEPFVEKGAIAWLKLQVEHHVDGPTGGRKLSSTTFVQRLNTHGGAAPLTGCASLTDVGHKAFVPYTADYFFYK